MQEVKKPKNKFQQNESDAEFWHIQGQLTNRRRRFGSTIEVDVYLGQEMKIR